MSDTIKILVVGDTVGRPGRRVCQEWVPKLRESESIDFVIVNGENMAGGSGITEKTALELLNNGVDVLTSGDHIFKNKNVDDFFHRDKRVLRPANYKDKPGFGYGIYQSKTGVKIGVINLIGRVFLAGDTVNNPFNMVIDELNKIRRETPIIILDIHAEATSEKIAMGWHLDGQVSGIFGTHTHVTTADETILPKGTAYITDVGMTGPYESVLGREVKPVLHRFRTDGPARFDVAKKDVRLKGVIMEIEIKSGKAVSIERIERRLSV